MSRLLLLALVACGSEDGLAIGGDLVVGIGDEAVTPTVGAAIRDTDPDRALIIVGTRDISCETDLQSPLRKGTYAMIVIDRVASMQPAQVTVIRVTSSGTLFNGGIDEVVIDQVEGSIAGSVDFSTTDDTDDGGTELSVAGTFEVENCFP